MIQTGFDVRIKIQDIIESQLPEYVQSESPLLSDFLAQYYIGQEYQGGPVDLVSNLDQYIKLDSFDELVVNGSFYLTQPVSIDDTEIFVNTTKSFPNEWGLLKIDSEIITYTGITTNSFTGCVRGFSGITAYNSDIERGELVFQSTEASVHENEAVVENLSALFLKEFYRKLKYSFAPGLEDLEFTEQLDVGNFLRNARAFFQNKGTNEAVRILFLVLYNETPKVIDLEQFVIKPSEAKYNREDIAIVEAVQGDPLTLRGKTIFQKENIDVEGAIADVEPFTRNDTLYYRLSLFVSKEESNQVQKLFKIPARSKVHRAWTPGDTTLTVDTTIGFPDQGYFLSNGNIYTYEQKTVNQFLGVMGDEPIGFADTVIEDTYAYGINDDGEEVRVRFTGLIANVRFPEDVPFSEVGERLEVDSLGENILSQNATIEELGYKEIVANSFIYNTSVRMEVAELNGATFDLKTTYLDPSAIRIGDRVDIVARGGNTIYVEDAIVSTVDYSNRTVTVDNSFGIPLNVDLDLRRKQRYANSINAPIDYGNNAVLSNILNIYDATEYDGNLYVATNSLPAYDIEVDLVENIITGITTNNFDDFNGFTGFYSSIKFEDPVNFITGDLLQYTVQDGATPICEVGAYYVEVDSVDRRKIKLYVSSSFIGSNNNVLFTGNSDPGQHIFTLSAQGNREIVTQRVFKKIPVGEDRDAFRASRLPQKTEPGVIAVLTNGVEVSNYKSSSKVYFGPIKEVDAVFGGRGYSVVNPPEIVIDGGLGVTSEAKVTPVVKGTIENIFVDPQDFDINDVISITVTGGNNPGPTLQPVLDRRNRQIPFDSRITDLGGGIDIVDESIFFLVPHKLGKGDAVVYNNRGLPSMTVGVAGGSNNPAVGNLLSNGGIYYADPLNDRTIRLYPSIQDLNNQTNAIGFTTGTGGGIQSFDTLTRKTVTGIRVINQNGTFWYRNLKFKPENVSIVYDSIRYPNHGFEDGEIVQYQSHPANPVVGLSTDPEARYKILKNSDDEFCLAWVGVGATDNTDYLRRKKVRFGSQGVGIQTIRYPEIKVNVVVSYASSIIGEVVTTPVVRGEIVSCYVDEPGSGYGSDILDFQKIPDVNIITGSDARAKAFVVDGRISSIQILNPGKNYYSVPDVRIEDTSGSGTGAILRAILKGDGTIDDLLILNPGRSYVESTTVITIVDPGKDAILVPRIRDLTLNLYNRFGYETLLDGKYSISAYQRNIREDVYNDFGASHSPIIGWALDGNPIYGGFGYSEASDINSGFRAMKTSYTLDADQVVDRPSVTRYPAGTFVEDYIYDGSGDLDYYNGRYCKTPEFPNGIYAYFAGISTDVQSLARDPQFPYFIGDSFRDAPVTFGNDTDSQDFNLNDKPIYRNTFPYMVGNPFAGSEFITESYLEDIQDTIVTSVDVGTIDSVTVVGAGNSYRVGDQVFFTPDESGQTFSSFVNRVRGKEVVSIVSNALTYDKSQVKLIWKDRNTVRVYVDPSHEFDQNDNVVLSGLSSTTQALRGTSKVSIGTTETVLISEMPPSLFTSVEDIFLSSIPYTLEVGSELIINPRGFNAETVKVLNIFPTQGAIRVERFGGNSGGHQINEVISVVQKYFEINRSSPFFDSNIDVKYYFNPHQTIGVGAVPGESYSTTYSIAGIDKEVGIPVQSIYAPGHSFKDNEVVDFSKPDSTNSVVATDGVNLYAIPSAGVLTSTYYVADLGTDYIGIRTSPGAQPLFFSSNGSDDPRYFIRSSRFFEVAEVSRVDVIVTTDTPHDLMDGDTVRFKVTSQTISGIGTRPSVEVKYDVDTESLVIDGRSFAPSSVDVTNNLIQLPNHEFLLGDRVLYKNSGTAIGGLVADQKYFVVPFDSNSFKLAETSYDITSTLEIETIPLTSSGVGIHELYLVNPRIRVTGNNDLLFDVSDSSLLGRDFKFFYDKQLTEEFGNNGIDPQFVVSGVGTIGYPDAKITLKYSENSPSEIYYGISKGGFISTSDRETRDENSIVYIKSEYNVTASITVVGVNTFRYSLLSPPEVASYNQSNTSTLEYSTTSRSVLGGVAGVRIISNSDSFVSIPQFDYIKSQFGINASLRADSTNIGRVVQTRIQSPGWEYSADKTLSPKGRIQPRISFDDSDSVSRIEVLSGGSGYQSRPDARLINEITREVVDDSSISFEFASSNITEVNIEAEISGLSKDPHRLYTVNNSNGIPILLINSVNETSGIVTFSIQTPVIGYLDNPPFQVGDKVFVENVVYENTPSGPSGRFNSVDYGYKFFDVVGVVTTNPVKVAIRLPDEAKGNIGYAKTFQEAFSSIVNSKIYPTFQVFQDTATLGIGERLSYIEPSNNELIETDLIVRASNKNYFKVTGSFDIVRGMRFKGNVSGITVTVTEIGTNVCRFIIDSTSRREGGWYNSVGFTNEEFQCISDNDYYQSLSYSIRSQVPFNELVGPVNTLIHPAGLKNFSDTQIESSASLDFGSDSATEITLDFSTDPLRVDRINVFDLGYDNEILDNKSNAIRFNSRTPNKRLTDYVEVRTNRVLLMDDVSSSFIDEDNITNQNDYIDFNIVTSEYTRGLMYVRNPFTDEAELSEIVLLTRNNNAYYMDKSYVATQKTPMGRMEGVSLDSTEYTIRYIPTDPLRVDLDMKLLTQKFTFTNGANQNVGYALLSGENYVINPGVTQVLYQAVTGNNAVIMYCEITDLNGVNYYVEVYGYAQNQNSYIAEYGFSTDSTNVGFSDADKVPGTFTATVASSNRIQIRFTNTSGGPISVVTKNVVFKNATSGDNPYRFKRLNLRDGEERSLILQSSRVTGLTNAAFIDIYTVDARLFQAVKTVVFVEGPGVGAVHQLMTVNQIVGAQEQSFLTQYPFLSEGENLPEAGIGTFGSAIVGDNMVIRFYPDPGLPALQNLNITTYNETFYRILDITNYRNNPLIYAEAEENYYLERYVAPEGERTNVTSFPANYLTVPIYQKEFDPDTDITDPGGLAIFEIDDHFFSNLEEIVYIPNSSVGAAVAPITIVPTTDYRGIVTDIMPDKVYVIKRDLNRFSVAGTYDDAVNGINIEVVGIGSGNAHIFSMQKKLERTIISIDGVIQSPISYSRLDLELTANVGFDTTYIPLSGVGTMRITDLLLINEEFVRIDNIGFGSTIGGPIDDSGSIGLVEVRRGFVGTAATNHSAGDIARLHRGSYNIVGNNLEFTEAPSGKGEFSINESNLVEVNSSFQGRVFLQREYDTIRIYDDISSDFDGQTRVFNATGLGSTIPEIENGSGILIINDIYQTPTTDNNEGNNYFFSYNGATGINSITFTGITSSNGEVTTSEFDVNQNEVPRGGLIVSVGSTPGLGYAPLIGAVVEPVSIGGSIIGGITTNIIGVTTEVRYAKYFKDTGELVVTAIGTATTPPIAITGFDYERVSGSAVVTVSGSLSANGITRGDILVLSDIAFSCPSYSFTNVGVVTAVYDNNIGILTITLPNDYNIDPNEYVTLAGLAFTCAAEHAGVTTTIFPDGSSPFGSTFEVIDVPSPTEVALNVGVSTIPHVYLGGGTATVGITTTVFPDKDDTFIIDSILTDTSFAIDVGISTIAHTYAGGGTIQKHDVFNFGRELQNPLFTYLQGLEFECTNSGLTTTIFPDTTEAVPFITLDDAAHYRLFVGVSTITHEYLQGGVIGQYTKNNPGSGYNSVVRILVEDPDHVGADADVVGIPTHGGELIIQVNDPGSGYVNPTFDIPDPSYENLPVIGYFRRSVGFTTITGKNLFVDVEIGAASTTAVGRSEFFEVSNFELTNQGYSFEEGDIIEVVGLVTDKRLVPGGVIAPFRISIERIFTDSFSAWNFGETDYIDSINALQDGARVRFPLTYKGETLAFEQNIANEDSAAIDLSSILMIYVNGVLQVPELNYTFEGGTSFEFTRAPLPEDIVDVYFYRGKRNLDSATVTDVNESIRPGDVLQIMKNNAIEGTATQQKRTVTEIASSDTLRTEIYNGDNDLDSINPRQVAWEKQKRDKFIYGLPVTKDRDSIEAIINPQAHIIRNVSVGGGEIFIDRSELFDYEERLSGEVLTDVSLRIYPPYPDFIPAVLSPIVSPGGQITGVTIVNGGQGYYTGSDPGKVTTAKVERPPSLTGTRATINISINPTTGTIFSAFVSNQGSGYSQSNPPYILIKEPTQDYEDVPNVLNFQGYSGIITGIQATDGVGFGVQKGIKFFFEVDPDVVVSQLVVGYPVVVTNTPVGSGVVSIEENDFEVIGIGTQYVDNVYKIQEIGFIGFRGYFEVNVLSTEDLTGINTSGRNLGGFSWGRLTGVTRDLDVSKAYNVLGNTFNNDMTEYPLVVRTGEGLRNEGGLSKEL